MIWFHPNVFILNVHPLNFGVSMTQFDLRIFLSHGFGSTTNEFNLLRGCLSWKRCAPKQKWQRIGDWNSSNGRVESRSFPIGNEFFWFFLVWIFFGFWNFCQFWGVSWPDTKNGKLENLNSAKLEITSSQGPCLILSLYLQLVYQSVTEIPKRAGKLLVWWHLAWLTSFF